MPKFSKTFNIAGMDAHQILNKLEEVWNTTESRHGQSPMGFKVDFVKAEHKIEIQSPYLKGSIRIQDQQANLDGDISWMGMPFKKKIEEFLERWVNSNFKTKA